MLWTAYICKSYYIQPRRWQAAGAVPSLSAHLDDLLSACIVLNYEYCSRISQRFNPVWLLAECACCSSYIPTHTAHFWVQVLVGMFATFSAFNHPIYTYIFRMRSTLCACTYIHATARVTTCMTATTHTDMYAARRARNYPACCLQCFDTLRGCLH